MNIKNSDEIDLIKLFKIIYNSKKIIFYVTSFFLILGIIVSLLSPATFNSSTVFIPQNQENNSSSLSGVASLVGINLGSSSYGGEIAPSIYPQISDSPKFKRILLNEIVERKKNLTLKDILIKHYGIKEDKEIKNYSPLLVTDVEEKCFNMISKIISINVNQKDGFVTITATMPVAEYAAILAKSSRDILQKIIIENKIETARQNLDFSVKQLSEKKEEFDEIQSKLAYFSDSNLNAVNSFVINEKNKLEAEFQIISAVVTELSKQVEQAKLQVTKDTPVFSTLKEAVIPNIRTTPKRKQIVIIYSFVGFILSIIFILMIDPLRKIINEIKSN